MKMYVVGGEGKINYLDTSSGLPSRQLIREHHYMELSV